MSTGSCRLNRSKCRVKEGLFYTRREGKVPVTIPRPSNIVRHDARGADFPMTRSQDARHNSLFDLSTCSGGGAGGLSKLSRTGRAAPRDRYARDDSKCFR